jgi:phage antirepressor YoqD-like protein
MFNLKIKIMFSLKSAQCAKIFGLTDQQFKTILEQLEFIESDNTPKEKYVERNLFSVYLKIIDDKDKNKQNFKLTWFITPIGLDYIHKVFLKHGVNVKPSIFI